MSSNSINSDSIYKYIGLFIVSLFVIYIVLRTLNFQANIVKVLATGNNSVPINKGNFADTIANNTSEVHDVLLTSKNQKSYEDIIINLESNINYFILNTIINSGAQISANPLEPSCISLINSINTLKTFKDTLNDSMAFLDKTN